MFINRSRLFYDHYRLNTPKGNSQLKLTPEQMIYQFADIITKVFPVFNQLPYRFKLNFNKRILNFLIEAKMFSIKILCLEMKRFSVF